MHRAVNFTCFVILERICVSAQISTSAHVQSLQQCDAGQVAPASQQEALREALAAVDAIVDDAEGGPEAWEAMFPGGAIPSLGPPSSWDSDVRCLADFIYVACTACTRARSRFVSDRERPSQSCA
jgi:hypothetical protein